MKLTELQRQRFHEQFRCGVNLLRGRAWVQSLKSGRGMEFDIDDRMDIEEAILVAADQLCRDEGRLLDLDSFLNS